MALTKTISIFPSKEIQVKTNKDGFFKGDVRDEQLMKTKRQNKKQVLKLVIHFKIS